MGIPTLEVGYTSATTGRGDHEVHKGHVVALERGGKFSCQINAVAMAIYQVKNRPVIILKSVPILDYVIEF
jgi:hypothetical protein